MRNLATRDTRRFDWVLKGLPVGPRYPFDVDLFDDGDFVVCPTIGSITSGWLLLVPRKAAPCIAHLRSVDRTHAVRLAETVRSALRVFCGATVMFEHGARRRGARLAAASIRLTFT